MNTKDGITRGELIFEKLARKGIFKPILVERYSKDLATEVEFMNSDLFKSTESVSNKLYNSGTNSTKLFGWNKSLTVNSIENLFGIPYTIALVKSTHTPEIMQLEAHNISTDFYADILSAHAIEAADNSMTHIGEEISNSLIKSVANSFYELGNHIEQHKFAHEVYKNKGTAWVPRFLSVLETYAAHFPYLFEKLYKVNEIAHANIGNVLGYADINSAVESGANSAIEETYPETNSGFLGLNGTRVLLARYRTFENTALANSIPLSQNFEYKFPKTARTQMEEIVLRAIYEKRAHTTGCASLHHNYTTTFYPITWSSPTGMGSSPGNAVESLANVLDNITHGVSAGIDYSKVVARMRDHAKVHESLVDPYRL